MQSSKNSSMWSSDGARWRMRRVLYDALTIAITPSIVVEVLFVRWNSFRHVAVRAIACRSKSVIGNRLVSPNIFKRVRWLKETACNGSRQTRLLLSVACDVRAMH
ncbi:hypothetical protein HBI57_253470 [Parastagonospora nodorum]|nr:hypothetical protein HBI57_253470 [Parastagonospora nodorum]